MEINYLSFLLAFLVSVILTTLIIFFYTSINNYIKTPVGPQKIHKGNVPRLGGLSIYVTFSIFTLFNFSEENHLFFKLLFVSFPVFVFGFFEDITQSVTPKLRLFGCLISSVLFVFIFDNKISNVGTFYIDFFLAYETISILFTIFCIIFLIQAFNIIDGLNGLSLSSAILILLSICFISYDLQDKKIFQLTLLIISLLLGVLLFNFPYGRIFIGDAGAYVIGFLIAIFTIILSDNNKNLSPIVIVQILIFPAYELIRSIIRRIATKKRILKPDKKHLHSLLFRFNKLRLNFKLLKLNSYTSFQIILIQIINCLFVITFYKNEIIILCGIIFFIILYEGLYKFLVLKIRKSMF